MPKELEEAALIDGGPVFTVLRCIVLPFIFPGMATVTILVFIFSWNEFLMSLIVSLAKAIPVTVGASLFVTAGEIRWGEIAAAITMSVKLLARRAGLHKAKPWPKTGRVPI